MPVCLHMCVCWLSLGVQKAAEKKFLKPIKLPLDGGWTKDGGEFSSEKFEAYLVC